MLAVLLFFVTYFCIYVMNVVVIFLRMGWDRFIGVACAVCTVHAWRVFHFLSGSSSSSSSTTRKTSTVSEFWAHIYDAFRRKQKNVKTKTVWRQTHSRVYIHIYLYIHHSVAVLLSAPCRTAAACCSSWAEEWLAAMPPAIIIFRRHGIYSVRSLVVQSYVCG